MSNSETSIGHLIHDRRARPTNSVEAFVHYDDESGRWELLIETPDGTLTRHAAYVRTLVHFAYTWGLERNVAVELHAWLLPIPHRAG